MNGILAALRSVEGVLPATELVKRQCLVRRIKALFYECDAEGFLLDDLLDEAREEFLREVDGAALGARDQESR